MNDEYNNLIGKCIDEVYNYENKDILTKFHLIVETVHRITWYTKERSLPCKEYELTCYKRSFDVEAYIAKTERLKSVPFKGMKRLFIHK